MYDPTYMQIGDHTETLQMDYDPSIISYEELVDIFWSSHDSTYPNCSQYGSICFYHDDEQKEIAERTRDEEQKKHRRKLQTRVEACPRFWLAEDYHQKYTLQQYDDIMAILKFKDNKEMTDSPLATKLNGYLCGHGQLSDALTELAQYNVDDVITKQVASIIRNHY